MERKLQEEENDFAPELPAALQPKWQALFDYRRGKNRQLREVSTSLQRMVNWFKHRTFHQEHHGNREINLNDLLEEELEGYQTEPFYKKRVTKRFHQLERLPPIFGLYTDFSQSLCNLIDNALEAMQEVPEPVLTVTTTLESGRRVIAVGDNGPGIPEALQGHIFNPFFSTKSSPEKPRAGLGLFLTRRLLHPYNGEVSFESRPGQTWFRIVLP
jgi:signal transduction histidine kinase